MTELVIGSARLSPDDAHLVDLQISRGRISHISPSRLPQRWPREACVIDARGKLATHGLHDAHIHLFATARARESIFCGAPEVRTREALARALAQAIPDRQGWVRGVGYAEEVAGELNAGILDSLRDDVPVRIQHRSGALWILNSLGVEALELHRNSHPGVGREPATGRPDGRLWRADELIARISAGARLPDLSGTARALCRFGVTHLSEATPGLDAVAQAALSAASSSGVIPQHLRLLGAGDAAAGVPLKLVIADSRAEDFDFDALCTRITAAHRKERPVAVHSVTRHALALLLAALEHTGTIPGDRIEHASVVGPEWLEAISSLGLQVVTQPGFIADRGDDYLRSVEGRDLPDLYRLLSLIEAGVDVRLSSDSPYGPMNPWTIIRAAVQRRTPNGVVLSPGERLDPWHALSLFQHGSTPAASRVPLPLKTGDRADVIVLDPDTAKWGADPSGSPVQVTVIAGRVLHSSTDS